MKHQPPGGFAADGSGERDDVPPFVPSIDMQTIFRQLIADEIRNGRLGPSQRRRIVRYAAQLGLTAVQAGRLVSECREEALLSRDPVERGHALRIAPADDPIVPTHVKIALVVGAAIVLDLVVFRWLWS